MDAPPGYDAPTFGSRLLARLLDGLVVLVPALVVASTLGGGIGRAVVILLAATYEIALTARDGQTLGKRALGIRVVDVEHGGTIDLQQAFLRWLVVGGVGGLISLLVSPGLAGLYDIVLLGPILRPPLHRGLHDRAAGTIVTKVH